MKEINPRRMLTGSPGTFGNVAALVLLAACLFLPETIFGYEPRHLLGGYFIKACVLGLVGYFLWRFGRIVFGKKKPQ